nr:putative uncharacterized protein LRRC75A-AS1, mitochondrial [Pongo pygmaeus]
MNNWPKTTQLRSGGGPHLPEPGVCEGRDPVPRPAVGSVQTRENWIAYPLQRAEDGVATRLQIREESAACLAAEYWSQEPAMRF